MTRIWIACLFVIVAAYPAAAQTRVRLEVEVESWLDATPFDAVSEFTAKLSEAHIEVVDDLDVPLVRLSYEETATAGVWPGLVPATHITLRMHIEDSNGLAFQSMGGIRPSLTPKNFPSAAEMRVRAIDDLRQHQSFRLLGHEVGGRRCRT